MDLPTRLPKTIVVSDAQLVHCAEQFEEECWDRETANRWIQAALDRVDEPFSTDDLYARSAFLKALRRVQWWKRREWLASGGHADSDLVWLGNRLATVLYVAPKHPFHRISTRRFAAFGNAADIEPGEPDPVSEEIAAGLVYTGIYCWWISEGGCADLGRFLAEDSAMELVEQGR